MKKVLSLTLCVLMLVSMTVLGAAAVVDYDQPFDAGTLGSESYRIPALYTLNDGSVIAGADIRYDHGSDSPNNIDIAVAISENGYTGWSYNIINYFDDYSDDVTDVNSASYIDSAIAQSKKTGRIFVIADMYPSGGGWKPSGAGTGYIDVNGEKCMLLTKGDFTAAMKNFEYYIGTDGVVYNRADNTATEYTVDAEFRLCKNGEALMMKQNGSDKMVQQNVFYEEAELSCYKTSYIALRYSDDNGKTWSAPQIITKDIKTEKETFLGVGPGRGLVTTLADGTERILFCVYDNAGMFYDPVFENSSVIYSDDNGATWHRSGELFHKLGLGKTSEAQLVQLTDDVIRMYARNNSNFIAYADSTDGGETWTDFVADEALEGTENCMVSFITTSKTIDGKKVILNSAGGNVQSRADGVIRVGLIDENTRKVEWITTYHINAGFFAYSCLTELADGNFAILYEDQPAHMTYMVFTVDAEGKIAEINGADNEFSANLTFWDKVVIFFKDVLAKLLSLIGML